MEKKYALQGIAGCLLFGIGDWLLGFVDPAKVNGDVFYFISAGHGADYPLWKITVTLITAVIGALFMHQGCVRVSDLMKHDSDRSGASRVFAFLTISWLVLHLVVTVNVCAYSCVCRDLGSEQAAQLSHSFSKALGGGLYISYFFIAAALADLVIVIARGRTYLRRREAFFTPLTWICLIGAVSLVLPESPFSKGLYTFCMNGGMILWFARMLLMKRNVPDIKR